MDLIKAMDRLSQHESKESIGFGISWVRSDSAICSLNMVPEKYRGKIPFTTIILSSHHELSSTFNVTVC